ncbi:selenoprotein F [Caerostris extrusa]|uniref:Selenoprotein F n=1 Tax=Caerostris extrusa TaxID=172846 RepID=A0AAV4MX74_CAEEX|nr:selenoprotein F [Caerostris extrusa]
MTLRYNIAQYTTRAWPSIDAKMFSTHSVRTWGLYDSVFNQHGIYTFQVHLYFVLSIHQKTYDPRLKHGRVHGILPHKLAGKLMMIDIQCSIRFFYSLAFVRSDTPNEFSGLSIKYVRGADPVIKLLDADGNAQEELSIQKWDTDTVIEFLREHLE